MPQPVDLQTEIGRMTAAERIQQISDRVSLLAQQRQLTAAEEARVDGETAVQQPEPKNEEVETEARRRNPFAGRRRRRDGGAVNDGSEDGPDSAAAKPVIDADLPRFDVRI